MRKFVSFLIASLCSFGLSAQSADFVTELLSTERARFGQVCYLSAVYQNLVPEDASEVDAMNALFEAGVIPGDTGRSTEITYAQTSGLFARFWGIKGGLFYRLTGKNARYAFKQFKADGIISPWIDPAMVPSGFDVLNLYTAGDMRYMSSAANGAER